MKDLLNNSPVIFDSKEKKENNNSLNKDKSDNGKTISEFNLGSEYFNINDKNENKNLENIDNVISSSISSGEENFNFYNIPKTNIINYMTPIKVNNNNIKSTKKKEEIINKYKKNKTNNEESNELFSISNSSIEDKKVMISELDIELPNSPKNNFLTEYKSVPDKNTDINIIKKREIEFKKQIEQNLKKYIKSNQENNNRIKNNIDKNKLSIKMRLKKYSQNINYCFTDISHKLNKNIQSNNSNKSNNLASFISIKKKLNENNKINKINNNNSFKTRTINIKKNNMNKKMNGFIKINKRFNNKILKTNELIDSFKSHRFNFNTNINNIIHNNKKIRNEYFSISEQKRNINRPDKKNLSSLMKKTESNLNEKNIIIQNFNCIDYNNINININNNNIIESHKLSNGRNLNKSNIFNNNSKNMTSIRKNILLTKEKPNKLNMFYKSYLKNFYNNTGLNKNKKKGNEKKLILFENNSDIKNKTLNYYFSKKNENLKIKEKNKNINNNNKIQNKLNIKTNDIELKKYSNTINTNSIRISKPKAFKNNNKITFAKLLMSKKY